MADEHLKLTLSRSEGIPKLKLGDGYATGTAIGPPKLLAIADAVGGEWPATVRGWLRAIAEEAEDAAVRAHDRAVAEADRLQVRLVGATRDAAIARHVADTFAPAPDRSELEVAG